jgi:hypothetical protein
VLETDVVDVRLLRETGRETLGRVVVDPTEPQHGLDALRDRPDRQAHQVRAADAQRRVDGAQGDRRPGRAEAAEVDFGDLNARHDAPFEEAQGPAARRCSPSDPAGSGSSSG